MRKVLHTLLYIPVAFVLTSVVIVAVMKYLPITYTPLMLKRKIQFEADTAFSTRKIWVPLKEISPQATQAIILSEDARFWNHKGVDIREFMRMYTAYSRREKRLRGCSTISQQVAKNCFTFCSDTYLRKIAELYWTSLIEMIWGKERILEVYLNVAEMGYGIYGIEAASQKYFHCSAKELTIYDASALAVCMPSPLKNTPALAWKTQEYKIRKLLWKLL